MTGIIILSVFVLVIAGLIVWFVSRRGKEQKQAPDKPGEKDIHETYNPEPQTNTKPADDEERPEPTKPSDHGEQMEKPAKDAMDMMADDAAHEMLEAFGDLVEVNDDSQTFAYLRELLREAIAQRNLMKSYHDLPLLYRRENFPVAVDIYDGHEGDDKSANLTLTGWLTALLLTELRPDLRQQLLKRGYEMGGYHRNSPIYGYRFDCDPIVARIVGSAIYAAMRGQTKPDIEAMRSELGGQLFRESLAEIKESDSCDFDSIGFYVDFRQILPSAPGPYAPDWMNRPDKAIMPDEPRDEYANLDVDRKIHEQIVLGYNLDGTEHHQETVQAIADKEADMRHIFGGYHTTGGYDFHPVFGTYNLGKHIAPYGNVAELTDLCMHISSYAREILQSREAGEYGRLRPGCSWQREARPNSDEDLRRDVLTCFAIEDGDGHPTGYYDENGRWTVPDEVSSPEDYEAMQRRSLWANSYPSGHSAGITGAATVLTELMPGKADIILRTMNEFAMHRTLARYHWTSDTLIGRTIGAAIAPLLRTASDYDTLLAKAREELNR